MNRRSRILATLLSVGVIALSCTACRGETHSLVFVEQKDPTCTEAGNLAYFLCTDCGQTFFDEKCKKPADEILLPALGHDYPDEWQEDRFNCLLDGTRSRICTRCDESETEILSALKSHTFNTDNTCTVCNFTVTVNEDLTFREIVEGNKQIGYSVHGGTSSGKNIIIPRYYNKLPVIEIEAGAFQNREDITGFVNYADLRAINASAFEGCEKLREITLPETLLAIGENAFRSCRELTAIRIPDCVTTVGDYAFYGCTELKTLEIGAELSKIGRSVFLNSGALEKISVSEKNKTFSGEGNCLIERKSGKLLRGSNNSVIPETVVEIGDYAFFTCEKLTRITIPRGVKKIGVAAFRDCINLKEITFEGTEAEWSLIEKGSEWSGNTNLTVRFAK